MAYLALNGKKIPVTASIPVPINDPGDAARFVELMGAAEIPGVARVSDFEYWRTFTEPPIVWLTDDADLGTVQLGIVRVMVAMGYSRVLDDPCSACGGPLRERDGDMLTECTEPACGITHDELGKPIPVVLQAR